MHKEQVVVMWKICIFMKNNVDLITSQLTISHVHHAQLTKREKLLEFFITMIYISHSDM